MNSLARTMQFSKPKLGAGNSVNVFLLLVTFVVCASFMYWLSALSVCLVVYCLTRYVNVLGREFAFAEMMALIAAMQWLLGPVIAFYVGDYHYKFRMYVDEVTYMQFAFPAMLAFTIGIFWLQPRGRFEEHLVRLEAHLQRSRKYGIPLVLLGVALDFGSSFVPASLAFVVFLVAQFKYIGVLYLLVGRHPQRWLFLILVVVLAVWNSAETGLFHNLILWSAFLFSYIAYANKITNRTKYGVIVAGLLAMAAIQTVKAEYREASRYSSENRLILLSNLIFDPASYQQYSSFREYVATLNVRLNQGWIISAVMNNVPAATDYAGGQTFSDALTDSLVPRFLVEKRRVSVSDNFRNYTGLPVAEGTSMGISILGESYANFAIVGGIVFMGLWGLFISLALKFMVSLAERLPTIFLWAPLIFLQMVKAETEMAVVLNHGVKSAVVVFGFYFVSRKLFGWKV